MTYTVADAIADSILTAGVERIYQVPGESFLGLLDSLRDAPIKIVTARQEGGAGFMALGEGRLRGRSGVAMVTRGPGAANAAIAIHTAYQDATPLVMFVGLIPTQVRDTDAFQEFDLRAWFGSTAKAVFILDNPETAGERTARAFEIAESGRPGPVIIGLPEEMLLEETTKRAINIKQVMQRSLKKEQLTKVATAINNAEKPVFIVGGDGWDEEDVTVLRAIAEKAAVAVVSDFRCHDIFPHSSKSWVGSLGFGRNPGAEKAYDEADLAIYFGTARKDVLSDSYTLGGKEKQTIIVNTDAELLNHVGNISAHYTVTPKEWLKDFPINKLETTTQKSTRLEDLRSKYVTWSTPDFVHDERAETVTVEELFWYLENKLPKDAIITAGAGNYIIGALRYIHHEKPRTFIGPRNGAMGMGIPAAVAAALRHPDKTVVAFAGDGCFGMNGQELAVLQAYGAKAIIFVIDNAGFGTIRSHQEKFFPDRPSGTYLENPDYKALGESHGIKSHRIENLNGFETLLNEAINSEKSTLFHIILPPIAAGTGKTDGTGLRAR